MESGRRTQCVTEPLLVTSKSTWWVPVTLGLAGVIVNSDSLSRTTAGPPEYAAAGLGPPREVAASVRFAARVDTVCRGAAGRAAPRDQRGSREQSPNASRVVIGARRVGAPNRSSASRRDPKSATLRWKAMPGSRPVIGICTALTRAQWGVWDRRAALLPVSYIGAIQRAGGLALMIPPDAELEDNPDQVLDVIDGLILAGGDDIDPVRLRRRAAIR